MIYVSFCIFKPEKRELYSPLNQRAADSVCKKRERDHGDSDYDPLGEGERQGKTRKD